MKIEIMLSEMEGIARNKLLFDIGNIIEKDIMNAYMEATDSFIQSDFGSIYITEEYILIDADPGCVIELSDLLSRFLVSGSQSIVYGLWLKRMIEKFVKLFNKKWRMGIDYGKNDEM